jgi:hypothetical protein
VHRWSRVTVPFATTERDDSEAVLHRSAQRYFGFLLSFVSRQAVESLKSIECGLLLTPLAYHAATIGEQYNAPPFSALLILLGSHLCRECPTKLLISPRTGKLILWRLLIIGLTSRTDGS